MLPSMPAETLELNARHEIAKAPLIWRLGRLFNVVTNIMRARVSDDSAYVQLRIEGTDQEVAAANDYLRRLGLIEGEPGAPEATLAAAPENEIPRPNTIFVRLSAVDAAQGHATLLYRLGKDFQLVVNIERAAFDEEEGGRFDIALSGPLIEVQRGIAYLHTTGIHVNPRQRSVTDFGNL